jgi:hypothetical protein
MSLVSNNNDNESDNKTNYEAHNNNDNNTDNKTNYEYKLLIIIMIITLITRRIQVAHISQKYP